MILSQGTTLVVPQKAQNPLGFSPRGKYFRVRDHL
jgi:hypothetical protein